MVLKRKRVPARRNMMRKRRRIFKRPARFLSMLRPVYSTKRTRYQETWSWGSAATDQFFRYYAMTSANINNFAEYASVFDEYKVCALRYTFRPAYDSVTVYDVANSASPSQPQAYAHVCIDPAGTTLPSGTYSASSLNTFLEQDRVKTYPLNKPFSIYFKPKSQDQLFGGSTATRIVKPGWIKTTNTAVDFRGFYIYVQQNGFAVSNAGIKLDVFITAYLQFRNPK